MLVIFQSPANLFCSYWLPYLFWQKLVFAVPALANLFCSVLTPISLLTKLVFTLQIEDHFFLNMSSKGQGGVKTKKDTVGISYRNWFSKYWELTSPKVPVRRIFIEVQLRRLRCEDYNIKISLIIALWLHCSQYMSNFASKVQFV